jgi:hypothetical protein
VTLSTEVTTTATTTAIAAEVMINVDVNVLPGDGTRFGGEVLVGPSWF